MHRFGWLFVVTVSLLAGMAVASDLAKERRWAAQIVDALLDGEALYLNDGRADFLAIETESNDGELHKAAIVMHGTGVHPDWPTVVQPLRVRLIEHGWHTLSIQMPVLGNDAAHEDYAAIYDWVPGRINAAVAHLRAKGAQRIVLLAHSQGSTMSAYYLAESQPMLDGFIAIGMSQGNANPAMDNLRHLPRIALPMLDLYGSEDLPEVIASAADRKARAGAANRDYEQQRIEGADHFFDGEEDALLDAVNAWLDQRY